ncbi:hypothetical protein AKJ41_01175 [candidate division MSBL1 archaeon SCGC-AAA259O05]|uniref:Radical SAM core domain-containing protein n=1 Tax=candidate division MSBL1 archaeon SCGC-AAA259O05 TaxID=1698271 RepID=A0A133V507_9EURY|nr:hypothetical protein AKJ41_01175 [candidate division MSBL1 archaeon SCGC-AAA259O05]
MDPMTETLEEVESICPDCLKEGKVAKIDAQILEENGKIWIKKECQEHGEFKSIYFGDPVLYGRWMKYKVQGDGVENAEIEGGWLEDLPKLYPKHNSQTVLSNLMVTNRCNLRCSYCFMNAGAAGYVYEPSLEELEKMMRQVREERPVPNKAIQITGGEPTVRDDLIEIVELAEEMGFTHIQVNTNGIKLAEDADYCRKLREAGVNTIYMSFDGMSKDANPWIEQNKKAVENLREAELGVVLVPVPIKGSNLHELGDIIRYAADNVDIVRGVNFQPIAFCGRPENVPEENRTKRRVDYALLMEALEEDLGGQIKKEDFYPVPFVHPISKLMENLKGEKQVEFTPNPGCGGATYAFVQEGELVPITRFIDVEGLMDLIRKQSEKSGMFKKARIATSLAKNIMDYVDLDKAPEDLDIKDLIVNALLRGDYGSLGKFHLKSLFIGSMWFQDPWNLNLERLKNCVIHYTTPDGIVPFCAYNGLGIGGKIRERYSMPIEEWEEKTGKKLKEDLWKGGPIS